MIVITNRKLCKEDFLKRIEKIAEGRPEGIILREKDLSENDFQTLAISCLEICQTYNVPFGINQRVDIAEKLQVPWIHLSVSSFANLSQDKKNRFKKIGVSVHSVEEAKEMEQLGADYLIAGHIYPTDCKKGVPARGLSFLQNVCDQVSIPVFAIGGICKERVPEVLAHGAAGVCVMSGMMVCKNPAEEIGELVYLVANETPMKYNNKKGRCIQK